MRHGRDHEEREHKVHQSRTTNTPEELGVEGGELPPSEDGSAPAPTERAAERERVRHEEEMRRGRTAAGLGANKRDRREPDVTREDLDAAADAADQHVGAKPR